MSVQQVSETHFPNAENFTKILPVLYPSSALGHKHKEPLLVDTGQDDHADALLLLVPSPHGSDSFLQCALLAEQHVGTWAASYST